MCNQAVSLMAAEMERRGIATAAIILWREVAEKVRPPRALCVPFKHGYPLGRPHDADGQRAVLDAALKLIESDSGSPPMIVDYQER